MMADKKMRPPIMHDPIMDMVVEAVRTVLPTLHAQLNQTRLNTLQVRQAAIRATNKSIRAGLDADKQFFKLAQEMLPIVYKQTSRMRLSLLEIHEATISALNQAMEQSLKTDQQLYEACLELLNDDIQPASTTEDVETEVEVEEEVEVEVVPDEEIVEVVPSENAAE
jgi:hypothetical protein